MAGGRPGSDTCQAADMFDAIPEVWECSSVPRSRRGAEAVGGSLAPELRQSIGSRILKSQVNGCGQSVWLTSQIEENSTAQDAVVLY
jgi:hypothetical protein